MTHTHAKHAHKNRLTGIFGNGHSHAHSNGRRHKVAKAAEIPAPMPPLIAPTPAPVLRQEAAHQGSINTRMLVKNNDNVLFNDIAVTISEQLNILKHSTDPRVGEAITVLNALVTRIDKYCGIPA